MFHAIKRNPISKYDISWSKFRKIIFIINFIIKSKYKKINNKILFTFDDGYYSQLLAARYLALYYKNYSIIFISTSYINNPGYISEKQIKRQKNKFIFFGSHGHSHISLDDQITKNKIIHELKISKDILEKLTNANTIFLSFPNGLYSKASLMISYEIGYKYIFTSKRASNRNKDMANKFNRFVVLKNTPFIILFIAYFGILDNIQSLKRRVLNLK